MDAASTVRGVEHCDLCIVGAGIAGLNALFAAAEYPGRHRRVVLIDRASGPGGMWNDIHDHARLHQPHAAFTVGDMAWDTPPRQQYATAREVAAHLDRCFRALRPRVRLTERFGHQLARCEETGGRNASVRIEYHPNARPGDVRVLHARRVIRATGRDLPVREPLAFSSANIRSTTPARLRDDGAFAGTAPVYVVGAGRTGVDTAHALIAGMRGRRVSLVDGGGMELAGRDRAAPQMHRRWREWGFAPALRDLALRFDGGNQHALPGLAPGAACDAVARGLDGMVPDYLEDVVDGPNLPEMVLRGGGHIPVAPGSIFVNCAGHPLRRVRAPEQCLSPGGAVLSITPRATTHVRPGIAGYLLAHLFLSGKLTATPLYQLDGEALLRADRLGYQASVTALTLLNTVLACRTLPLRVIARCGLDPDRRALPVRCAALLDLACNGARYAAHCRRALDRVRKAHGVRCGPILAQPSRMRAVPARLEEAMA